MTVALGLTGDSSEEPMPRRFVLITMVLLATTGELHAQNQDVASITGCYFVDFGEWQEEDFGLGTPDNFAQAVQLTDTLLDARWDDAYYALKILDSAVGEQDFTPEAWWFRDKRVIVGDIVAFAGFNFNLGVTGDSLSGTATAFTDALRDDRPSSISGSVVLRKRPCPN